MRCIVMCQPFASAVFMEGVYRKDIENRAWRTKPGPLAIMAGKSLEWFDKVGWLQRGYMEQLMPWEKLPFGKILGWVEVGAVMEYNRTFMEGDHWAFGPVCWKLWNPRKLMVPIPYRGRQGIFHIPYELLRGAKSIG